MLQQAVTEYSCVFTKKPGTNFPDTVCSLINTDLYSHEACLSFINSSPCGKDPWKVLRQEDRL